MNWRDWIRERADEIADEEYGADFDVLPEATRAKIWGQALDAHTDAYSAYCDSVFERIKGAMIEKSIGNR